MKITKYKTVLNDQKHNALIEETSTQYYGKGISSPGAVAKLLNDVFAFNRQAEEYLYMIAVDTKNKPLGVFEVFHGTVADILISPRELFIRALLVGATSIFIAHNHPSGDCNPSREDILVTKQIDDAGALLGIPLQDHIIVGDKYYSFRENRGL